MGGAGFGGGVLFEEVADFEVEVWEVSGAAEPVVVGVDIGEGYDLAAFEGCRRKAPILPPEISTAPKPCVPHRAVRYRAAYAVH